MFDKYRIWANVVTTTNKIMPIFTNRSGFIQYEIDKSTAYIRLNRPKASNALSAAMASDVLMALEQSQHDAQVKMVVIESTKPEVFSGGGDIRAVLAAIKEGNVEKAMATFALGYNV